MAGLFLFVVNNPPPRTFLLVDVGANKTPRNYRIDVPGADQPHARQASAARITDQEPANASPSAIIILHAENRSRAAFLKVVFEDTYTPGDIPTFAPVVVNRETRKGESGK
jgi:hypothetical protein